MKQTMTVRINPATREALASIASALDRDRSYVVNQALEAYIELHRWQLEHIRRGLREARAEAFVPEAEAGRVIDRLRRK
ncbi:MAG: CopG family transcriptional regulator [Acidobacteria bacterium]|nr:CopG family transcriptional regulator [Acidobacteriota bacterium]